jgi:hypothetical protein
MKKFVENMIQIYYINASLQIINDLLIDGPNITTGKTEISNLFSLPKVLSSYIQCEHFFC